MKSVRDEQSSMAGYFSVVPNSWLGCIFIILLGLVVYIPAMSNGFIWDDDVMLTENVVMKAPDGLQRIWFSNELSDYFPLTSTTFWVEWRIWGANPIGYNLVNIFLHTLAAIFFWRVLLRLKIPGAWVAAVLFTVHPVCVASVDWIAERKNTLSLVFYFAALLCFFRFEQEHRRRFYGWSLFLFMLALLSKTSVVVLPVVLLLCAWWQRQKISRADFIRMIPFFILALVMGLVTVWFQLSEVLLGDAQETDTFATRVLGGGWALWFYFSKVIFPVNLSMIYEQRMVDPMQWVSYLPGILWLTMVGTFWRFRQTWGRPCFFAFGYFTIALGPVLGFIDMNFLRFSQVADHLQYIALPGLIAFFVAIMVVLHQKFASGIFARPLFARIGIAVPILILSVLTWKQSSVYADEETLWRDTIQKNPSAWIGYHNLADRLAELKRYDEASIYYQEALRLKPDFAKSHNNLGNCLHLLGQFDDAVDQFLDAIQNKPELAEAHHNLGATLFQKQEYAAALESFKKAIALKPDYASAYFSAGNCAFFLGDLSQALNFYFAAERYQSGIPDVQYNIGLVLSVRGETNAAIRHLKNALRLNASHSLAQKELNLLLAGDQDN